MNAPWIKKAPLEERRPQPVLGLLGAPGSGKSHVARVFKRLGAAVIDADALAHDALNLPEVRDTLVAWWGELMVAADGLVDRAAVAQRVFESPDELARLEGLVHPVVHLQRAQALSRHRANPEVVAVVEDCPLLLEKGLEGVCDALVWVETPLAVRQERVAQGRGWTAQKLAQREKNQMPLDTKRQHADYVLDGTAADAVLLEACRQILLELGASPDVTQ